MKRTILCALLAAMLLLTGCHRHEAAVPAACTAPSVCTVCGRELAPALGHEAGPEATCAAAQVCTRCGAELTPALSHTSGGAATCTEDEVCAVCGAVMVSALGHDVGEDGACRRCGQQIVPAGRQHIAAGSGGAESDGTAELVPETENTGHYHNTLEAYYSNYVLVCGDYGLECFYPDSTGSSAYASVVNRFAAAYPAIRVSALLTPKNCAFETPASIADPHDSIRDFIQSTYEMMDASVTTVDAMGEMERHRGEYLFYRTDHHWTSLGAYYASAAYCAANGLTAWELDSYETSLRTGYVGSLYGYAGKPDCLLTNPDYSVARYPHTGYAMVYYRGGAAYNGTAVNGGTSGYAGMFLCGDQPLTVIDTDNTNGRTLLVFKESYGNAFVPYMIDYYQRIVAVDIREYSGSTASLVAEYGVTDALFLNNCQAAVSLCGSLESRALS